MTGKDRLAAIARKARRVQDATSRVRATATCGRVWIEVAADGRITGLTLSDPALAQAISAAHRDALQSVRALAAGLRGELADDPTVLAALHSFAAECPATTAPPHAADPEEPNPYALPAPIRRRYGLG
ncbi:hypothetical protein [Nocardia sp. NPDC020380]|uniref:hypothetical protein n=1 Tax=Nocardia sp. NPDC020380 TaxID=3364309 RepID=UPI0037B7D006